MNTIGKNPADLVEDEGERFGESDGGASTHQVSRRTNVHDEGSDANDTPDGLTESEEAMRHATEDGPAGQGAEGPIEAVPVFERGQLPPKV